jgi:hypothetical protein
MRWVGVMLVWGGCCWGRAGCGMCLYAHALYLRIASQSASSQLALRSRGPHTLLVCANAHAWAAACASPA